LSSTAFAFALLFVCSTSWGDDGPISIQVQSLSFGVVPQQATGKLARQWEPLLDYLSEKSGLTIRFFTAKYIPTFEKRLAAGVYDLAYMNPYHYTVFHKKSGYEALARAKDKQIKGIIVTRKDSSLREITELEGAHLSFPSPAAFAASILTQSELKYWDVSYTPHYVSSHDAVYRTVAKGIFPAGGGVVRTFMAAEEDIRQQLQIFWRTTGYTPHAIAVHPRVSSEVVERIQQALLDMDTTLEGKRLLEQLKIKGWQSARDADWDDVRNLDIKRLKDLGQQ